MNLFKGKVFYDFFLRHIFTNFLAEVVSANNYHSYIIMYIFSSNMEKRSSESNQYQTNRLITN